MKRREAALALVNAIRSLSLAWLVQASLPSRGGAQSPPDRKTVAAGAGYRAGWVHRLLLGAHYRDLWATPLEVEVLNLSTYAGGLTPGKCGGGRQTKTIHFTGSGGRDYAFRSVDKDPTLALPPDLRATFVRDILQDQISSAHPGGPLVVAPLLDAAGVRNTQPRLFVLPNDQRVTGLPCASPGELGMIEERPTEGPDGEPTVPGAVELATTKKLFEHLQRSSRDRVDSRAFLAARLMDVLIGDWDRHQGQWRWARFDSGAVRWWRPLPRDRDQAFSRMDGAFVWVAGFYHPELVGFGDDYPSIWRLTLVGRVPDRRLLVDLEKPVWDSLAKEVQQRLTDSVIAAAVRRLPPEYYAKNGATLERALRRRRDQLLHISDRYYALLAQVVEIHGTDAADIADVERLAGGRLSVRLSPREGGGPPYYRRTFDRRETAEVRLYLHGGDDSLIVHGSERAGGGPRLRVITGGGHDQLVDSARAGTTRVYDAGGNGRFVSVRAASPDRRHYQAPPPDTATLGLPRDWGSWWLPLTWVNYTPDIGVFVGAGAERTRYGFRRLPYASRVQLRAGYATGAATFRAEFTGEFRGVVPPAIVTLRLRASGVDVLRFYGFGNETANTGVADFYKVKQQQYLISPRMQFTLSPAADLSIGPVYKFSHTSLTTGTFIDTARPYGVGDFAQLGAAADLRVDTRDAPRAARRGILFRVGGAFYPAALDVDSAFGEAHAEASSYVTFPLPLEPTLAVRVAGKKVWGRYPFHEAAYVGGATTVRGYYEHRFAGDAAVYTNAELHLSLARFYLLVPARMGVLGLGDVGRVYLAGVASQRWHAGVGGGLWFSFLNRTNTLSVAAAHSVEGTRVYAQMGFAF